MMFPRREEAVDASEYASSRRARQAQTIDRLSSSMNAKEFKNLERGLVLQI